MRVLAHIHVMNDEAVIDRSLGAVLNQTHPVDEVVLVDNGSTDATLDRRFPEQVTVIRHGRNLGTNGAVHTGMKYALEQGYDWVWLFDGDSAPRPDALAELFAFYDRLPAETREEVWLLASLPFDNVRGQPNHGTNISPEGISAVDPPADGSPYLFISTIWSGSLFRIDKVRDVGLPSPDYVLDWGENAYGYEGWSKGYKAFMVQASVIDHNIDTKRGTGGVARTFSIGPLRTTYIDLPPIRCYYLVRNAIYLWLYVFSDGSLRQTLRALLRLKWIVKLAAIYFLLRRWRETFAILRAIKDGLRGRLDRRY